MAVTPGDIDITREQIYKWIEAWNADHQGVSLEDYVRVKVRELQLPDEMVNTLGSDALGDETHIEDMVISDLNSYSNYPDDTDS